MPDEEYYQFTAKEDYVVNVYSNTGNAMQAIQCREVECGLKGWQSSNLETLLVLLSLLSDDLLVLLKDGRHTRVPLKGLSVEAYVQR